MFVDRLPGKPDNIRARKEGGYYISLVAVDNKEKVDTVSILARLPLVRKLILRLLGIPKFLFDSVSKMYPNQFTENASYKVGYYFIDFEHLYIYVVGLSKVSIKLFETC